MKHQLNELRIGPLRLDFPVVQAALSGYSDLPMRGDGAAASSRQS
jgi:hypothetical protein